MSARVNYQARDAIMLMDMDKLTAEIKRQAGQVDIGYNKEEVVQQTPESGTKEPEFLEELQPVSLVILLLLPRIKVLI